MEIDNIIGIFQTYGIEVSSLEETSGSQIDRCKFKAKSKEDIEKFHKVKEDLSLALKSSFSDVRTYIPKTETLNIVVELPKAQKEYILLNEVLKELRKEEENYKLPLVLGRDLENNLIVKDITETGNIFVSGATGTGKSVFLHSVICTLLKLRSVAEVKLVIIDTLWGSEYLKYNGILQLPDSGITNPNNTYNVLLKISKLISRREEKLKDRNNKQELPYYVIIIEDLATLMLSKRKKEIELFTSLVEKGNNVGVYFILSTSKPNHKVLTKSLQENITTRIAFSVATKTDSSVILGEEGAETLIGSGDMLYIDSKTLHPERIQAPFIRTEDIEEVVKHVDKYEKRECLCRNPDCGKCLGSNCEDDDCVIHSMERKTERRARILREKAMYLIQKNENITTTILQRELDIGYEKAFELLERYRR